MRPNILLIVTDQLTPLLMGSYGHPLVQTPHLDSLARAGVRWDYTACEDGRCRYVRPSEPAPEARPLSWHGEE